MKKRINIHVGEYHASSEPAVIYTVLGSCVAVCLFDPVKRIGGMNHILLPGRADMKRFDSSARYGINAMELLINRIMDLKGDRRRLVAKVFGGGDVITSISRKYSIGEKNVSFVLMFLQREGIRLLSKDVRGTDSRKVYFHTDTGEVFLKRIPPLLQKRIAGEELLKFKRVQKSAHKPGEITLFNE